MFKRLSSRPSKSAFAWVSRQGFPSVTAERSLIFVIFAIASISVLFTLLPELDLAFSRLFFDGLQFPLADNRYLQRLRSLTDWMGGAVLGLTVLLLCRPSLRTRFGRRPRDLLLPIITYGVGVGLIVNSLFKQYFGRARPRDILEFGGDKAFTAVWKVSDACLSNCSFTSGEAAGAIAIYSAMAVVPALGPKLRTVVATAIGCISIILSLNRIAFGAHFLSDVLLSIFMILAILLATKIAMKGKIGLIIDRIAIGSGQGGKKVAE